MKMNTNFQKVAHFNTCIGNSKGNLATPNWNEAYRQAGLVDEEFNELMDELEAQNIQKVRKELCDLLVTAYGLAHVLGIDIDADMEEVNQSNLSKLCSTPEEARATLEKYQHIGLSVSLRGDFPEVAVISEADRHGTDGKFYPKGKALKSVGYNDPSFT